MQKTYNARKQNATALKNYLSKSNDNAATVEWLMHNDHEAYLRLDEQREWKRVRARGELQDLGNGGYRHIAHQLAEEELDFVDYAFEAVNK